jgi:ABC-type multidrug transport system fused ATPase/permease subunit
MLAEFRPHRRSYLAACAGVLLMTACTVAIPLVIGIAVDRGVRGESTGWIVACLALGVAFVSGQVLGSWIEFRWMGRFAERYLFYLRGSLLDHLYRLDLDYFTHEPSGRLVARLTADVENLQQFVQTGLSLVLRSSMLLLFTTTVMFVRSWQLALAALAVMPGLVLISGWYRPRAYAVQLDIRESTSNMLAHVNESIVGMRVVQAFAIEPDLHEVFRDVSFDTYDAKRRSGRFASIYYSTIEFLHPIALACLIGVGGWLVSRDAVTTGTVIAFTIYLNRLFEPIQQFTELNSMLQSAGASFARVFEFRARRPKLVDHPGAADFVPGAGEVRIERVRFRYRDDGPDVIPSLDLTIPARQRVAVVGTSGAGKSTLAKLVARFYDPTEGRVLVDGQDVRHLTATSLRRSVVVVPQEGFMFDGTVAGNIGISRPGATRDDVEAACRALGFADRLDAIPGGYDAPVSNRGLTLSSGQRQLVALARAFLAEPLVIVLDEATSNLDPATDVLVEDAMQHLLARRTAIVIAHRINTALRADRVLVMEHGRVVEDGPPLELEAHGGAFARWVAATRAAAATAPPHER